MGDFAVYFFQKTLKQLIMSSNLGLIDKKPQLQSLEEDVKFLIGFLKATEKKRKDHQELMKLVTQIRDLVSEAENIVELFIVHTFQADHVSYSFHEHHNHLPTTKHKNNRQRQKPFSLDLDSVKKGIRTLTIEVKKIYDEIMCEIEGVTFKQLEHSSTGSGGGSGSSRGSHTSEVVEEEVVLGFEEKVERLMDMLDEEGVGKPLEIISIISAGGGGKTTLARKVYDHPLMSHIFGIRAWIHVSQDYDKTKKRDLLIRILESIIPGNYAKSSDDKLGEDVNKCLKGMKYLVVMDDIWGIEAWNDIQKSFPKEYNGSKVLFTSRLRFQLDVVSFIPYYLARLPTNLCWELLQRKVFGMQCCPPEFLDIGELIAKKCDGLPLAVVATARILATEEKTLDLWEKVAKNLSSIIAKNQEGSMEILELSYNHLPLHLKACFLYIGGYPEDIGIPVRELICLWIAEGLIHRSEGGKSLETIAKDYLNSLIDGSLVEVARKSPLGGIKVCRMNDLLREICLKKAEDDNFFVKHYKVDSFSSSATKKHRRLFIGHQMLQKFSLRPGNLRSILCLSSLNRHQSRVETKLSFFAENFELLKVSSFMSDTCHGVRPLVHSRYLAFTFDWHGLPFSYLLNLETLNLHSTFSNGTIRLPHYIFKMVKLRHLYTKKGVFTFHFSEEEAGRNSFDLSSTLDSLQTLHQICACEACRSFLEKTPNLRKLGLRVGEITEDNNVLRLLDLEFLNCLETLTLTSDRASDSSVESTIPSGLKLPLTVTRITFKYTFLKWEELSLLQTLPSLEVLRLLDYACCGPVWNTCELEGFPKLKYLKFNNLDIQEWNASEDQFPKLEVLVLGSCRKLEQIPIGFGELNDLCEINMEWCRHSAEESAREIQEGQRERMGDCLNLLTKCNWW